MKITNLKEKLFNCGLLLVIVILFAVFKIPCVFKQLFGVACFGCGMTRAYISLLWFDIAAAFSFHPMFWSVPVLLVFYLFDGKIFKSRFLNYIVLVLIGLGFFANWIVSLVI